jgi:hypothetical protein
VRTGRFFRAAFFVALMDSNARYFSGQGYGDASFLPGLAPLTGEHVHTPQRCKCITAGTLAIHLKETNRAIQFWGANLTEPHGFEGRSLPLGFKRC